MEEDRKRTHAPSSLDLFSMVTPRRRNNLPEMAQLFRAATVKSANTVLRCGATACVQRQDVCSCAFISCLAVQRFTPQVKLYEATQFAPTLRA